MRKVPILLLLFFSAFYVTAQPERVREAYRNAIGVHEATGHNDGVEVERYLASVGLRKGAPWCAAFVYYCLSEGGYTEAPRTGWSPAFFRKKDVLAIGAKSAVDLSDSSMVAIFGIYYPRLHRIAHTGFIEPVTRTTPSGFVVTVEGNTNDNGSREGVAVLRKRRPIKSIYAIRRF